jgi:exonuclease III
VDYLFNKWDLDVVCLQEVDTKLRERLRLNVKYFVFAPADEKEDDQCIILLKKKLPLVPSYFTEHYQEEESAVIEVKTAARRIFSDLQTFQR